MSTRKRLYQVQWDEEIPEGGIWLRRCLPPHPEKDAFEFYSSICSGKASLPVRNAVLVEVVGEPLPAI